MTDVADIAGQESALMLYVIQLETGPIKVGVSSDIPGRMASMRTHNPYRFWLVYSGPASYSDEARLCRLLARWNIQGEWFKNTPECRAIIGQFVGRDDLLWSAASKKTRSARHRRHRSNDTVHAAKRRLADGTERIYYYHPRTGTRLPDNPDSPEFAEALAKAKEDGRKLVWADEFKDWRNTKRAAG